VERLARGSRSGTTVGTVGVLRAYPGAVNVVPGLVELDVDIRDIDAAARTEVVEALLAAARATAERRELELDVEATVVDEPRACSPRVVDAARAACEELGVEHMDTTSGAYHDAMVLGAEIPMGMIFVPSRGGISHHPDEYTAPEEIERGIAVLQRTLARLAEA
jgi:hydantoinase/carbamoylase family amidase